MRERLGLGKAARAAAGMAFALVLGFDAAAAEPAKLGEDDVFLRGDAKCTKCHDETEKNGPDLFSIGKTKHGTVADPRTPGCRDCHGESTKHLKKKSADGKRLPPDRPFNKFTPATDVDAACTTCHKGGNHMFWAGSAHATRDVSCITCHDIHNRGHDKVRDRLTQTEVCFSCHKEQRAQVGRPSHHPVLEGKVICSDCHNPHGSAGPKLLRKDSLNETCYTCHMEKRGPFLHSHQPVLEDCSICHNAHGATIANLLKARPPFLCQECHEPTGHRSSVPGLPMANSLDNPGRLAYRSATVARGCLNCHTQIHGSNSPQNSRHPVLLFR